MTVIAADMPPRRSNAMCAFETSLGGTYDRIEGAKLTLLPQLARSRRQQPILPWGSTLKSEQFPKTRDALMNVGYGQ
jgi:hypothetical protein